MPNRYMTSIRGDAVDSAPRVLDEPKLHDLRRCYLERRANSDDLTIEEVTAQDRAISEFLEWAFDDETYA